MSSPQLDAIWLDLCDLKGEKPNSEGKLPSFLTVRVGEITDTVKKNRLDYIPLENLTIYFDLGNHPVLLGIIKSYKTSELATTQTGSREESNSSLYDYIPPYKMDVMLDLNLKPLKPHLKAQSSTTHRLSSATRGRSSCIPPILEIWADFHKEAKQFRTAINKQFEVGQINHGNSEPVNQEIGAHSMFTANVCNNLNLFLSPEISATGDQPPWVIGDPDICISRDRTLLIPIELKVFKNLPFYQAEELIAKYKEENQTLT
jgi:hypothetical protein